MGPLRHIKLLNSYHDVPCDDDMKTWNADCILRPLNMFLYNLNKFASSSDHHGQLVPRSDADPEDPLVPEPGAPDPLEGVPQKDQEAWQAHLHHYHHAAGHPTNKNLVHLFRDAGLESWKLHMARHFHCEACESIRPGGSSSGNVPPAATHESFKPCQAIQLDAREWLVPGQRTKIKFILFIDLATTFRAVHVVREYDLSEMKAATTADVTEGFSQKWLCDKPKPALLIPDNSKTFQSKEMHEFCNLVGIQLCFPPEKEGWAHGVVESALKDIKITASAIQTDSPGLSPRVTLLLACASLNSTEYTNGYSTFKWCFGKDYVLEDEDMRAFKDVKGLTTPCPMRPWLEHVKMLKLWLARQEL